MQRVKTKHIKVALPQNVEEMHKHTHIHSHTKAIKEQQERNELRNSEVVGRRKGRRNKNETKKINGNLNDYRRQTNGKITTTKTTMATQIT